jgi:aspartate racemase
MKTIGLLGGMSWESTLEYYRIINQEVKARLGGLHSARCLLYSVDFAEIEALQHQGQWSQAGAVLVDEEDSPVPLFPTTRIHAVAAVDCALQSAGLI